LLYHRFSLRLRDVEELLAKRGIIVSYETIRQWCRKFGPEYARKLRRRKGRLGDIWYLGEVFVKVRGERHNLWRAVDRDGDLIDILVQRYRERQMRRFKSAGQAQHFLSAQGVILNFFRFARRRMRAKNQRWLRARSFKEWSVATTS
jgi:putative transposase